MEKDHNGTKFDTKVHSKTVKPDITLTLLPSLVLKFDTNFHNFFRVRLRRYIVELGTRM